jgi:aldehyde dehydrogenase (NAD+)
VFITIGAALALNPLVGAIAAGNAAVLKCSENAPSVSALIARLLPLYLDSHAIRVVEGTVAVGEELLKLKWDKIFYTGLYAG